MILKHYYSQDYLHHVAELTESRLHTFCIDSFFINFFVKEGANHRVINSSPFYGSHGGFYKLFEDENLMSEKCSMESLVKWLTEKDVTSLTIVENPYASKDEIQKNKELLNIIKTKQYISYDIIKRFSSVRWTDKTKDVDDLMAGYHSKTRNCLRKYLKSSAEIKTYDMTSQGYDDVIYWLANEHNKGIQAKNGVAKPLSYFQNLKKYYEKNRIEIKISYLDGELIAGLLNFKTCNQVEYWTPVTTDLGKVNNAIYGLIHDTLKDITGKDGAFLNFGGSWDTQNDLQRFKLRFGSEVKEYRYHCFIQSNSILKMSPDEILKLYPNFFVRKFN